MKPSALLIILSMVPSPSSGAEGPPRSAAPAPDTTLVDAWVGFRDKGIEGPDALAAALTAAEGALDPRTLARRRLRRTLPGLVDEADLPLHGPYLTAVAATGVELRVRSRWMNGVTVLGTRGQLDAVAALPFVVEVTDFHVHVPRGSRPGRVPRDPDLRRFDPRATGEGYGATTSQIQQLGLDRLHQAGFRGAGIRIGVVDTGFFLAHSAFDGPGGGIRVVAQWDFMDGDGVVAPEEGDGADQHEHGSVILGTMAADLPGIVVGSAPEAEYLLAKAEDAGPEYFLEERWFVAALEFLEGHGADIITSSVVLYTGYAAADVDGRTSVMAQGWRRALGNGVVGLQGAGNAAHDDDPTTHHLLPPAGVEELITVGAVDAGGEIAPFSSDGPAASGAQKPELLARGSGTVSVSPYDARGLTLASGTSMATPVLAGGVACVLQARPSATVQEIRALLFRSASDFLRDGRADPLFVRGYGIPDLARAAGLTPPGA